MSKNKPNILLEGRVNKDDLFEQVIGIPNLYIVVYKNKPISLKWLSSVSDIPKPKYRRTVYTQYGHALNLVERLNKEFNCKDFSIMTVSGWE